MPTFFQEETANQTPGPAPAPSAQRPPIVRLKRQYLPIVVAEPSDLPVGTEGEFITADTLKPYLDKINEKATPADITLAINNLKSDIFGGVLEIDADTMIELNAKIIALTSLSQGDKTGLLNLLAQCVRTDDIMPIVNAKANTADIMPILDGKADAQAVSTLLGAKADKISVNSELATKATESSVASRLATKAESSEIIPLINAKANQGDLAAEIQGRVQEIARVDARIEGKTTEARAKEISDFYREEALAPIRTDLSTKVTGEQASVIAQAAASTLRSEVLSWQNVDDSRFNTLQSLLAQLQNLESGDVTGLNTSIATKVDKSNVLSKEFMMSNWGQLSKISDWINTSEVDSSDASILGLKSQLLIFKEIVALVETKSAKSDLLRNVLGTLEQFLVNSESEIGSGKSIDALKIQQYFAEVVEKFAFKFDKSNVITEGELALFNTTQQSDEKVLSAAAVKNRFYEAYQAIEEKANYADVYDKTSVSFMLDTKATRTELQAANEEIETLKNKNNDLETRLATIEALFE